jgi:hypothetical protein
VTATVRHSVQILYFQAELAASALDDPVKLQSQSPSDMESLLMLCAALGKATTLTDSDSFEI